MTCDVESGRWDSLPLEMSRRGVDNFKRLTEKTPRQPMVYVHVEMPSRRVLRIGKAEHGIYRRWATDPNGHLATFKWATSKSGPYQGYAGKFPHYVLFFRLLDGMATRVWFLTCSKVTINFKEKELDHRYVPVWKTFLRLSREEGVRQGKRRGPAVSCCDFTDPALPTLEGLQSKRLWSVE